MKTFGEKLKELRQESKISQKELADKFKISKSAISMYENNNREPSFEILEMIADYFNVDMNFLVGKSNIPNLYQHNLNKIDLTKYDNIFPIKTKKLPLLGEIACGEPIFANEDRESYIEVGTDIQADFCLRASGDSMINARIFNGDIVFIREQNQVENGEIAAIVIDDEVTLKRVYYYPETSKIELKPENPTVRTIMLEGEELNHVKILGKAIAFQSDVI